MTMTFQTESTLEMAEKTNVSVSLMNRVYYAARDGMAITLYALLSEQTPEQINCLINQVKRHAFPFFFVNINSSIIKSPLIDLLHSIILHARFFCNFSPARLTFWTTHLLPPLLVCQMTLICQSF